MQNDEAVNKRLNNIRKQLLDYQQRGMLKAGVDIDMAAIIAFSGWYGALLACSKAKSQKQRLEIADRFADEFERAFEHGVIDFSA